MGGGQYGVFDVLADPSFSMVEGYDMETEAQAVADVFNREHQCSTDLHVTHNNVSGYYYIEYVMAPFGTERERRSFRSRLSFKTREKARNIVYGIFLGWGLDSDRARWIAGKKIRDAKPE